MKKILASTVSVALLAYPCSALAAASAVATGTNASAFVVPIGVLVVLLLMLVLFEIQNRKKTKAAQEHSRMLSDFRKAFINANDEIIYLKGDSLQYVFVNAAFESFFHVRESDIVGKDDFAFGDDEFAKLRRISDLEVLEQKKLIVGEIAYNGGIYETTKFPVRMENGMMGVGAYVRDITEQRRKEKERVTASLRNQILLEVFSRHFSNRKELMDYALNESLKLTGSKYGYIYLYDDVKCQFSLNSWSSSVMEDCSIKESGKEYLLEKTGIWGDVVRKRKPIVLNDYQAPHPQKKGYPDGHVNLKRLMCLPVFIADRIVATAGFGNKEEPYDDNDVYEMTLLMSGVWNAVQRLDALQSLSFERNMSMQTLLSIGDGVMVVDREGRVQMLNSVAEKLTGFSLQQALGKQYSDVFLLSHDASGKEVEDPIEAAMKTGETHNLFGHAILTSKDGARYTLEDSAAPIKDDSGNTAGVVVVFRDATKKVEQQRHIEYLSFHDSLTGLYNRRFFEEEMRRLDTPRNLPITMIMLDVNNLKLTNDIFGHSTGDELVKKVAQSIKGVCRSDDIIARWGGDEFVLMMTNTNSSVAASIQRRIKSEFAKQSIRGIRGSIAVGYGIKTAMEENLQEILHQAEEQMYVNKTLEHEETKAIALEAIVNAYAQLAPEAKQRAQRTSSLVEAFAKELQLGADEVNDIKEAAYLTDIGKIALDPAVLSKSPSQLSTEAELQEFRRHPLVGYRILKFFDAKDRIAEAVLSHQEQWDAEGYPKKLRAEEIPFYARVIMPAFVFDRLYYKPDGKRRKPLPLVLQELREKAGKQLDPNLTEAFIRMIESKADELQALK